jgi:arsenate reductase-like glutaredoxin family protein
VITLFHKPSVPSSVRALTLLKQAAGTAQSTATEDQASSHDTHSNSQRTDFELDVTEAAPTTEQFSNILEYVGKHNAAKLIRGARDDAEAMRKLKENADSFERPVVSHTMNVGSNAYSIFQRW